MHSGIAATDNASLNQPTGHQTHDAGPELWEQLGQRKLGDIPSRPKLLLPSYFKRNYTAIKRRGLGGPLAPEQIAPYPLENRIPFHVATLSI